MRRLPPSSRRRSPSWKNDGRRSSVGATCSCRRYGKWASACRSFRTGRSMSMQTADASATTAVHSPCACWKKRTWPQPRAAISARTKRSTMCALPTRAAWRNCKRESNGWRASSHAYRNGAQRAPSFGFRQLSDLGGVGAAAQHPAQARLLGHDFARVTAFRIVRCAAVHLQSAFQRTRLTDIGFQNLRADPDIDAGIEQRFMPAVHIQFVQMEAWHHLHQSLRAVTAFGNGTEARLYGHHRADEQRIDLPLVPDLIGLAHELIQCVAGHAVAPSEIRRKGALLRLDGAVDFVE